MSNIAFSVLAFLVGIFAGACIGIFLCLQGRSKRKELYDFHYCACDHELVQTMEYINGHGHQLISVTQHEDVYTVFFRRFTDG